MFRTDEDLAKALQYFEAQEDGKAEEIYNKLRLPGVHLTPAQNAKLLYQTALLYKRQGKRQEAKEQLRKLFHEGLHNSQPYNQTTAQHELGILAYEEKRYKEAIALFRSELSIWHSQMEHYYRSLSRNFLWQGQCFMQLGEWEETAMYLRHAETFAVTEKDSEAVAMALEAQVQLQMHHGKVKEALKLLKQATANFKTADRPEDAKRCEARIEEVERNLKKSQKAPPKI